MKKIVTILGAVLLTASTVQIASATERDGARRADRNQRIQTQQYRDTNAYFGQGDRGYREDGYGGYGYGYNNRLEALREGGGISAPAGR